MGKLEKSKSKVANMGKKVISKVEQVHTSMACLTPSEVDELKQNKERYYSALKKDDKVLLDRMNEYAMSVYQKYLSIVADKYVPIKNSNDRWNSSNRIRYFDITKWVFDKEEKNIEKLINVYEVLSREKCSIALIYDRRKTDCQVKIAVSNNSEEDDPTIADGFINRIEKSIKGNFPGVEVSEIYNDSPIRYKDRRNEFCYSIAAVSNIASDKSEDFTSQNMEKLLDGMVPSDEKKEYTLILLATPNMDVEEKKVFLSNIYSELSPFCQWQTNYAVSEGTMLGAGTNIGGNVGVNFGFQVGINIAKAVNKMGQIGKSEGITYSVTNYSVKHLLDTIEKQMTRLEESDALGMWNFAAYVISPEASVAEDVAHMYLSLTQGEGSFVSQAAINCWEGGPIEEGDGSPVEEIGLEISRLQHPKFAIRQDEKNYSYPFPIDLTTILSGKDMARALNFPRKSVTGLPVVESVAFGREVFRNNYMKSTEEINIGKIYHMHALEKREVMLDLDSLCSHVLVTGSTGKGKSNAIFKLIEQICDKKQDQEFSFMVIEPAKGEYKDAFYKHPKIKVRVLGTNPKETELIKINPFTFPIERIHVLEHIDRLSEIFNACWPMYAAMPAILKNAIIHAYENCGWDISNSINESNKYPNFEDVLVEIKKILNSSAFSDDNKGDYTGALCTRVESLTTGLNGLLFTSDSPISDEELFTQNVIVDLSRVGSPETKALFMSLLVMKLQEFRLNEKKGANLPLRHITVLEEAHNILKKTPTEQISESSNVSGMAVETLSNAIAEMRTYGEAFIIADQSPSLLDVSVIRNTNTKITFCLPDEEDRQLIGHSMGLSDRQILEMAKLERGVAVVYQNDWQEAVLCKFEKYHKDYSDEQKEADYPLDNESYTYDSKGKIKTPSEAKIELLKYLLSKILKVNEEIDLNTLHKDLEVSGLDINKRRALSRLMNGTLPSDISGIAPYVTCLYKTDALLDNVTAQSVEEWNESILQRLDPMLLKIERGYQNNLIQCLMYEESELDSEFKTYAQKWVEYMEEKKVK